MAIRIIRKIDDEVLRKKSKIVDKVDGRINTLLDDMAETMYHAEGVGLAAPQIGILRRAVVIDVGEGIIKLVNPEIIESSGEQTEVEGCLSIPNVRGEVIRPLNVTVKALNEKGEEIEIKAAGLLAIALCHEIDHLDGVLFVDKVTKLVE
ncbi:peptide deformylase [Oxobacter pfennigii]|uniref:Peptide deformylase n=1 Tax=Oxobacter pfennigii TaxID=36849 RepID=A0A0P8W5M1_9CLOT|nr:peptide deformylase [Oxobacter pfennigii]KPU43979.1 peptide deformylase [Oxobacter pfennigii]